jgi:hypothetical protein
MKAGYHVVLLRITTLWIHLVHHWIIENHLSNILILIGSLRVPQKSLNPEIKMTTLLISIMFLNHHVNILPLIQSYHLSTLDNCLQSPNNQLDCNPLKELSWTIKWLKAQCLKTKILATMTLNNTLIMKNLTIFSMILAMFMIVLMILDMLKTTNIHSQLLHKSNLLCLISKH